MARIEKTRVYGFKNIVHTPFSNISIVSADNWNKADTILNNIQHEGSDLRNALVAEITERKEGDSAIRTVIDTKYGELETELLESQAAQDTRLDELSHAIEILQPEAIEDYKRRLNAIENKVATNATLLASLSDNDKSQDARLDNLEAWKEVVDVDQETQNERLSALETGLSEYKVEIAAEQAAQNARMDGLDTRLTVAEREIDDMRADMDGFDNELITMTAQIAGIADVGEGMQPKALVTPVTVEGKTYTTVESALQGLAKTGGEGDAQPKTLSTPIVVDDVEYNTVETALMALATRLIAAYEDGKLHMGG